MSPLLVFNIFVIWPVSHQWQINKYTVNHKKRDILFLTITLAIFLTDFYSFYVILIVKKFYMRL